MTTLNPVPPQVVAILNSNDDLVEMMRMLIERAGFTTVRGHIDEVRKGKLDLVNFVRQHNPSVIVYDLVPPYERSWNYLMALRNSETMKGRPFVITSVNADRAQEAIGDTEFVYEVIGKPLDLDRIVQAVKEASRVRATPRAVRQS
jgi:DNA-binding NtrC family response regulator